MKKTIKVLFVGILSIFLLSGCIKHETTMKVNKDKSVDFQLIYAIFNDTEDSDALESGNYEESIDKEAYEEFKKLGFHIETYIEKTDDGAYEGFKLTKKYDSIDDVTTDTAKKFDMVSLFQNSTSPDDISNMKLFFFNGEEYSSNFYFEYPNNNQMDSGSDDEPLFDNSEVFDDESLENFNKLNEKIEKTMVLRYQLTLPKAAVSSNATSVDKKTNTYTWDLKYGKKNDILVTFKLGSPIDSTYLIFGGAGAAILFIIIALVVLSKKSEEMNAANATAAIAGNGQFNVSPNQQMNYQNQQMNYQNNNIRVTNQPSMEQKTFTPIAPTTPAEPVSQENKDLINSLMSAPAPTPTNNPTPSGNISFFGNIDEINKQPATPTPSSSSSQNTLENNNQSTSANIVEEISPTINPFKTD